MQLWTFWRHWVLSQSPQSGCPGLWCGRQNVLDHRAGHLNDALCSVIVLFVQHCGEFLKKDQWPDRDLVELVRISGQIWLFPQSGLALTGGTLNHHPHSRGQSLTGIPDVERPKREGLDHISPSLYLELLDWFHNKRVLALSKDRNTQLILCEWSMRKKQKQAFVLFCCTWADPWASSASLDHKTEERSPQAEATWPRDCWKVIHSSFPRSLCSQYCICK